MKANLTFKISLLIILNLRMGIISKFGNHLSQPYITLQKNQISFSTERHQRDSHEIFNFNAHKSRNSGHLSMPRWIYLATTMPSLTILGMVLFLSIINVRKDLPRFTG